MDIRVRDRFKIPNETKQGFILAKIKYARLLCRILLENAGAAKWGLTGGRVRGFVCYGCAPATLLLQQRVEMLNADAYMPNVDTAVLVEMRHMRVSLQQYMTN